MKNANTIFVLLLIGMLGSIAPRAFSQRHLAGLKTLEVQLGTVNNLKPVGRDNGGVFMAVGLSRYCASNAYWKVSYEADSKYYLVRGLEASTRRHTGNLTYYRSVLKDRGGNFFVNVSLGAFGGYESVLTSSALRERGLELAAKSKIVFGLSAGVETEWYFSDRWALVVQFREKWLANSQVRASRWQLATGIKWTINQ